MFDNICTLPLSSDLFAQAVHPTEPILSVGLSSGHVQTFRLPSIDWSSGADQQAQSSHITSAKSVHNGTSNLKGRRLSENGFDTIDTAWRTRRHKGSCRSLAFTKDGATLFSSGTDGIVKAATVETGRVTSKIAIPSDPISGDHELPSLLHILTPQTFLLGTDTARIYLYDLRDASPSARPSQTLRPHVSEDDPDFAEPVTSLTPLPPTAASTSGESKAWITTAGSTVAVSDLRKGVVTLSEDQSDELLSAVCVDNGRPTNGDGGGAAGASAKFAIGGAKGTVTLWERGQWREPRGRVGVHRDRSGTTDDGTVDWLAVVPQHAQPPGYGLDGMLAAGLGNGRIQLVSLRGWGGRSVGSFMHEEEGIDGVAAIDFDVDGRMISGGGQLVKVWHAKAVEDDGANGAGESDEDDEASPIDSDESDENEDVQAEEKDASSDDDSDDESRHRTKRRKKTRGKAHSNSGHGITAFAGMD